MTPISLKAGPFHCLFLLTAGFCNLSAADLYKIGNSVPLTQEGTFYIQGQSFTPSVPGNISSGTPFVSNHGTVFLQEFRFAFNLTDANKPSPPPVLYIYDYLPSVAQVAKNGEGAIGKGTLNDPTGSYLFNGLELLYHAEAFAILPEFRDIYDAPNAYLGGTDLFLHPDNTSQFAQGNFDAGFSSTFVVPENPYTPTDHYHVQEMLGWSVYIHPELVSDHPVLLSKALNLLNWHLAEIHRTVQSSRLLFLKTVKIWLEYNSPTGNGAVYHPSAAWLSQNGYNPDKAESVEISKVQNFVNWAIPGDQPSMILHELAHAYHDQVLTFDDLRVKALYDQAVEGGAYESVPRNTGGLWKAYALTDHREYFAEGTEGFLGENDFYPYFPAELETHDPGLYRLLEDVWTPPEFIVQPQHKTNAVGDTVIFTAEATRTLSYRWQWASLGSPFQAMAGETNSTLVLNGVTTEDNGRFRVLALTTAGTILLSDTVFLTVVPPPPSASQILAIEYSAVEGISLSIEVVNGASYGIEGSVDLTKWLCLTNFTARATNFLFRDSASINLPFRYYRVISPGCAE